MGTDEKSARLDAQADRRNQTRQPMTRFPLAIHLHHFARAQQRDIQLALRHGNPRGWLPSGKVWIVCLAARRPHPMTKCALAGGLTGGRKNSTARAR